MSLDDFEELLADKPAHEKWELIGGRVVRMMVGARWEHARIVQNIARHLGNALDAAGSRCQVFAETFFVKQTEMEAATLPDVMVVCGDLAPGATSTDAPVVIFEVMSAGSEARDRLEKWHVYQKLPSLRHYVLVARDHPALEVFDRENGLWSGLRLLNGADDALSLDALGLSLSLSDIYRGVLDRA
ncbi:Uma2 family endonuclease [Methylopila jiangsuensis]|nr:Uma2 family endonuclease [Methylopila jiangsuensis]